MTHDTEFEKKLKHVLQSSQLDETVELRLDEARKRAVAQIEPSHARRWISVAAVASVVGAAIISLQMLPSDSNIVPEVTDDMDLLLVEENLEFLEDMEFFQWLPVATDEG